ETRLGIPIIAFDEALHGLVREGATAFPQSIGLAATWDTTLMHKVGHAIAMETKTRGIRQILSPVVNIARDVRWGRTEETYGEDPFLTSMMGLSYMSELEKMGVIATPKHFAANFGDGGRDSYPIHFNERLLEEIYFPAFKTAFKQAGARSVMTSYNTLDGSPCTANAWLLRKKLKDEWKFKGFSISDAGATGGANVLHFTTADYAESTKNAIENGLDVIFQTSYDHYPLFWKAFETGMVNQKAIDDAVRRVLRAKFELGLFEHPYVDPALAEKNNGTEATRVLAKQAAIESFVLLKNEKNTLPLSLDTKSVAVIGTDAVEARLGGYSGPGIRKVSILNGLKNFAGDRVQFNYAPGCGRETVEYVTIPSTNLYTVENGVKKNGLKGEYFDNISFEGQPKVTRTDEQIQFGWTLFSPHESIPYDWYSVRWTGKLVAPDSGTFKIGIEGNDGYRIYINNQLISESWSKETFRTILKDFTFEKGKEYDLKVEYYEPAGNARVRLVWNAGVQNDWKDKIDQAVNVAKQNDLALVVVGINEGEFNDRALLSLPGHQEELIRAVAATGKPTVVVLVGGSAITMTNWRDLVPSILDVWYPGDAGGDAVAEVLYGKYSPAGRLPITFPVHEGQLPLYYNHKPTGRGDDYTNLTGQPMYPFGFGLSYTTFAYSDLKFEKQVIGKNEKTTVHFKVKNTGDRTGDEVVQLYIRDVLASVARPLTELKGFKRISLKSGEEKEVSFDITPEMLSMLDVNLKKVVEPGDFRIMIGASSKDIRLRGFVTVKQDLRKTK
ncbi:MAG: glycoside hydrolase family 3 C-terminal domain-containing protein, partial [Bacteroidota bacterium]|nr:glycoside hydrolase family 3 C-terminal domain-containing protein [Bacteroidota bacterium]